MKVLAHKSADFDSPIITVHEALRLRRNYPEEYAGKHFFDITRLRPMMPVNRRAKSSSFAFLAGYGGGHEMGSKGIAHKLVQDSVCKLRTWQIKVFEKVFQLRIASSCGEWRVTDPKTGISYYVDCRLNLAPGSDLYEETGGVIGIEVTDMHKTGHTKKKSLERSGRLILELKMIPDWHVPNEIESTPEDLRQLRARIGGLLNKGTRLNRLCTPVYLQDMIKAGAIDGAVWKSKKHAYPLRKR
jgi:hypothetical protein